MAAISTVSLYAGRCGRDILLTINALRRDYTGGGATTGVVTQHNSRALQAVVDIRQIILSPEQWHAVNPVEITTPRVRLRPLRPAEVLDLVRSAGNDQVAPMMGSVTSPSPAADVLR